MNFALRIPDYYKETIKEVKGDISMNQFINNAIIEKVAILKTMDYLQQRANNTSIDRMFNIMDKISDNEPDEMDKI